MNSTNTLTTVSCFSALSSVVSQFNGDNIMAWVMLWINIATLLSNAAISIYRKWRDRDKDLKSQDDKEEKK